MDILNCEQLIWLCGHTSIFKVMHKKYCNIYRFSTKIYVLKALLKFIKSSFILLSVKQTSDIFLHA